MVVEIYTLISYTQQIDSILFHLLLVEEKEFWP